MNQARLTEIREKSADKGLTRAEAQQFITELCDALEQCRKRREKPKFALSDVMKEAERMNWPKGLAEQCSDSYEAVGWVYGKQLKPIVSLPAAMRTWMRNHQKWNGPINGSSGDSPAGWDDFLKVNRYPYEGKFKHAPEYMRLEFATWKKNGADKSLL